MSKPEIEKLSFGLDRLLNPVGVEDFFSDYWERKHLHIVRGEPMFYDDLVRGAELASLVSDANASYPSIRLAQSGGFFPPEAYTHNMRYGDESFTGLVDVVRVKEAYRNGATVTLPAVDRRLAALAAMCRGLEADLSHMVNANAYLTPGNCSGFSPHYDTHEVFVLQIAGRKRWRLYPSSLALPHRSQVCTPQALVGLEPALELMLNPGDMLYLPRGTVHSAETTDSYSAHVSVGVTMYTAVELLQDLLHEAIQHPALRASLPRGFATSAECQAELRERYLLALDTLRAEANAAPLVERFTARVRASHRNAPERFDPDVHVIGPYTRLRKPNAGTYRWVESDPGNSRLEFGSQRFRCPSPLLPAMQFMLDRDTFCLDEFPVVGDPQVLLGLAKQLHAIGFLSIVLDAAEKAKV